MIVATSTDFAVLRGARTIAAGEWDDVMSVRVARRDEATANVIRLALKMRNGRELLLDDEMAGWEDFVEAAERALPDMRPFRSWFPEARTPEFARQDQVLFERAETE